MNTFLNDYIEKARKMGYELSPIHFENRVLNTRFEPKPTLSICSEAIVSIDDGFTYKPCTIQKNNYVSNI